MVKRMPTMWETRVQFLDRGDPLEKEMAAHYCTLAWKTPWTRSLVGYSPWVRKESDTTESLHFTLLQTVKNLSAMQVTWVQGQEDP